MGPPDSATTSPSSTLTETSTSTIPTSTLLVCPPVTTSLTTSSAMGPGSGVMWQGGARTRLMAASSSSPRRLTCLLCQVISARPDSSLLSTPDNKEQETGSRSTPVRCVQGERWGRMRAQEMVDHLWCARLSLGDGQLLDSCPGALDALLIYLEYMSRCLTTENGSMLININ